MKVVKVIKVIKVIKVNKVITSIVKMSQSSLSSLPSGLSLPILPPAPFVQPSGLHTLQYRKKKPELPSIDSTLFSSNLFSRTLLDTIPPTVQLNCLQLGCIYAPKPQLVSHKQTSNY